MKYTEEKIEELLDYLREFDLYSPYQKRVNELCECVAELLSTQRTGHWIEHPHEAGPNWEYSRYECSECHDWSEDDSYYCPNCGARMRGET